MSKKMCKLVKDELHKKEPEKFKEIIKGAKYFCKKCGHVSEKPSHLCKPEKI